MGFNIDGIKASLASSIEKSGSNNVFGDQDSNFDIHDYTGKAATSFKESAFGKVFDGISEGIGNLFGGLFGRSDAENERQIENGYEIDIMNADMNIYDSDIDPYGLYSDAKNTDGEEHFLSDSFDNISKFGGKGAELVGGFKDFLENSLFPGIKEQFGIDLTLDSFTKDVLNGSDNGGGLFGGVMSGVVALIKTFITACGIKLDDGSSEKSKEASLNGFYGKSLAEATQNSPEDSQEDSSNGFFGKIFKFFGGN